MSYAYTPYSWFQPKPEPLLNTPQGRADLKLIVDTCYVAILNCDDPAVRWQAAKLLQQIGPMKERLHA